MNPEEEAAWDRYLAKFASAAEHIRAVAEGSEEAPFAETVQAETAVNMQGQSEEAGAQPRAYGQQGGGRDPSGSLSFGANVPHQEARGPRDPQDIVLAVAVAGVDPVMTPEGGRAKGGQVLVALAPPEISGVPTLQGREQTREQAMAMQTIWRSAPGRANIVARCKAIVVKPSVGQHTTREANWRARGLAPLALTAE